MTKKGAFATAVAVIAASGLLAGAALTAAPGARFDALVAQARRNTRSVSVPALRARIEEGAREFVLIDVREDSEWAAGSLPGAVHLSKGVIERDIEKTVPDPRSEIILFCAAGARSLLAAESLQRMGYTNVFCLEGGARAWFDSSPVVKRPEAP